MSKLKTTLQPRTGRRVFWLEIARGLLVGTSVGLVLAIALGAGFASRGETGDPAVVQGHIEIVLLVLAIPAATGLALGIFRGCIRRLRLLLAELRSPTGKDGVILHDSAVVLTGEIDSNTIAYLKSGALNHAQRLRLTRCTGLVDDVALAAGTWPSLKVVELLDCPGLTSAFLIRLSRRPLPLRILAALSVHLTGLGAHPVHLERLVIKACPLVDDAGMAAITAWSTTLTTLELDGLPLLTVKTRLAIDVVSREGFVATAQRTPNLNEGDGAAAGEGDIGPGRHDENAALAELWMRSGIPS